MVLAALHAVPLALLGLSAGLAAFRRPELLVLTGHALLSLVAAWVHASHHGAGRTAAVLLALASTPVIAVLLCVSVVRGKSKDVDESCNSLRPPPIARLRPATLLAGALLSLPLVGLAVALALFAPAASVLGLNALLAVFHVGFYAHAHWPARAPAQVLEGLAEEDKAGSEESLRARQVSDWVGAFEDTRLQAVDEWSLSFATTASRRRSASTQSSPVRQAAARLYSPAKPRPRESYDLSGAFNNTTFGASTSGKTSKESTIRFARPLSPTPKAARRGFDESDVSIPAPPRLPPAAKVCAPKRPATPPRTPHAPVRSTGADGTPTSWLSSPGQSSILHPDWSFASSLSAPREPPYAFLAQDPAPLRRKRASAQTQASVSFSDYVSVRSEHSTSHQKLSDAPGTVKRASCPASLAESASMSVGGSILGDYSASPSCPLPMSFEDLRSFKTRTQSKSSRDASDAGWEFVPDQIFSGRRSADLPEVFSSFHPKAEPEARWRLGWPGLAGSLLVLGLSAPALLSSSIATRALLLAGAFVPPLVLATGSIVDPARPPVAHLEAEQKRIKYHPRDRSLRPSHGKLLRPRPALAFAPPSPLKCRPRTMSAAAKLRTLRGGIVSAIGHSASDSIGSVGSGGSVAGEGHGWLDAHIGVATKATRSRSPSVIKLDWAADGILAGIPVTPSKPSPVSAPCTPARRPVPPALASPARKTPRKEDKDSGDECEAAAKDSSALASAVALSPAREQTRRRTSAFASSGCDFSAPASGYAPSVRSSRRVFSGAPGGAGCDFSAPGPGYAPSLRGSQDVGKAFEFPRRPRLPSRAPLARVVTCPVPHAGPSPPPRLPSAFDARDAREARGAHATSSSEDSGIGSDAPSHGAAEGSVGMGRAVLGFNVPRTPAPPAPCVPSSPVRLPSAPSQRIDLYSTPARAAKRSESASIDRNAELARLLLETPARRHKRSFSGGSVRSHPYSVSRSARSSRSTKASARGHKSSASWASIKASLKSSLSTIDDLSLPRSPRSPRTPQRTLAQLRNGTEKASTPSTIARLERSFEDHMDARRAPHPHRTHRTPRSHPHPAPRPGFSFGSAYATPWDHPPLRARGPRPRPVPDVGSSYEVSSSREATRQRTQSEIAFARQLDEGKGGLRTLILAERHSPNEPVKRSPRFERTPDSSTKSHSHSRDKSKTSAGPSGTSRSYTTAQSEPDLSACSSRVGRLSPLRPSKATPNSSASNSKTTPSAQRTSTFGLGNVWSKSASGGTTVMSPNVRAGRGRDTSPVKPKGPKGPKPMRL